MRMNMKGLKMRIVIFCFTMLFLVQCSSHRLVSEAKRETDKMHWDRSFQLWEQIYQKDPHDTRAKIQMERSGMHASLRHLEEGLLLLGRGALDEAEMEFKFTLKYDPHNQQAIDSMQRLERVREELKAQDNKQPIEEEVVSYYPQLQPSTWEPLNLYFPKPTKIRDIYRTLGTNYGINILMDSKIKGDIPFLDLRNLGFLKALDTLMVLNRHFFKVIDEKTLVIFDDSRDTRERYSNQVLKTYYLSNAVPKDMVKHLKIMGDVKNFSENEELNAITIKGTPEQIAMADRIVAANDKAQAEVIIEIELLEVNKQALRDMGIQPVFFNPANPSSTTPMYQAGLYFNPEGSESSQVRGIFPTISSNDFFTVLPSIMLKLLKENSDSKQIFNPHVRVTAGKEAKIQIGQSVPVASTAFVNPYESGSSNNSIGDRALTSFSYKDAGIDIALTPRVHHNQEVTLDLKLSVTSVVGTQELQPIFGQRIVNTTIRLKTGESSVLAGLLSNDERQSLTGFPGLSEVPIIKSLFSSEEKIVNQTDIILLLRPVIVRDAHITAQDRAPYEISSLSLSSLYSAQGEKERAKEKEAAKPSGEQQKTIITPEPETRSTEPSGMEPIQTETETAPETDGVQQQVVRPKKRSPEPEEDEEDEQPAVMAFMPAVSQIRVDEPIEVQLFMTNVSDLFRGEVIITFDPEFLQIEDLKLSTLPVEEGRSAKLIPFWDQETGRASVIITPVPGTAAFSGSGILTNMVFRGLKPGTSELKVIETNCQTESEQPITFQALTGQIEVTP